MISSVDIFDKFDLFERDLKLPRRPRTFPGNSVLTADLDDQVFGTAKNNIELTVDDYDDPYTLEVEVLKVEVGMRRFGYCFAGLGKNIRRLQEKLEREYEVLQKLQAALVKRQRKADMLVRRSNGRDEDVENLSLKIDDWVEYGNEKLDRLCPRPVTNTRWWVDT
ncbi:hypothetical protein H072_229 [Dactylellina haptotyla CBS 200.50]|uniref:Uncharacterized protein n=1 Tax=Dactylellina haptotyla (strain CBS 200.50) TaxID=1284197 RepID=S8ASB7_DACHA|nr:hypothetical protein H072_229 [Dactylellina haptotyla CBS 200.50]